MRTFFLQTTVVILAINVVSFFYLPEVLWSMVIFGPLILLGLHDITQKSHSILRNFPVLGHMRFLLEEIRPEMYQYFVESDTSGRPFSREQRSVVYARAKNTRDTIPFGTVEDVYETGYEWVNHSLSPKKNGACGCASHDWRPRLQATIFGQPPQYISNELWCTEQKRCDCTQSRS